MNRRADPFEGLELFAGADHTQRALLATLSTTTDVPAGHVLCRAGDTASNYYVIVRGGVEVTVGGGRVARLGPGSGVGERALVPGGRRTATVTTTERTRLLVFTAAEFRALRQELPSFARQVHVQGLGRGLARPDGPLA